jgi:dihydroflavonol-4-reductase
MGWTRREECRAVNVGGARHVAEAARRQGARMVHVSSVDALAPGAADQPADEDTPGEKLACPYVLTKRAGEAAVQECVSRGLDAVIVNPGLMLGPWDWKPSSGRMLLELARHGAPLAPRGGISLCDARDVAAACITALRQGGVGRRYILTGHNMTYLEAWRRFAALTGGRGPLGRVGPVLGWIVGAAGDLWTRISGHETDVNSAGLRLGTYFHYYHHDRATAELDYHPRPAEETIAAAWDWFVEHGYARPPKRKKAARIPVGGSPQTH